MLKNIIKSNTYIADINYEWNGRGLYFGTDLALFNPVILPRGLIGIFLSLLTLSLLRASASTCVEILSNPLLENKSHLSDDINKVDRNAEIRVSFRQAEPAEFRNTLLKTHGRKWVKIRTEDEYAEIVSQGGQLYLSPDSEAGFGISPDKELISLFNNSKQKGLGAEGVKFAIAHGATWLRTFDGYLRSYYENLGFEVILKTQMQAETGPIYREWEDSDRPDLLVMRIRQPSTSDRKSELSSTNLEKEFSDEGKTNYTTAYNRGIVHYSGWQEAAQSHVSSIKKSQNVLTIVEAGGGTGRMTKKVIDAFPSSRVHLIDLNPAMTKYAFENGVPFDRIHISDISDMKLGGKSAGEGAQISSNSVDHIFSHSVIWMLSDPSPFLREAARILKPGGRLSISTARPSLIQPEGNSKFMASLSNDMDLALAFGHIDPSTWQVMISANRDLSKVVQYPLDFDKLASLGKSVGLVPIFQKPLYSNQFAFIVFEKP